MKGAPKIVFSSRSVSLADFPLQYHLLIFTCVSGYTLEVIPDYLPWMQHLMRFYDGRFACDVRFVLYTVNAYRRHKGLTVLNVYAKNLGAGTTKTLFIAYWGLNPSVG